MSLLHFLRLLLVLLLHLLYTSCIGVLLRSLLMLLLLLLRELLMLLLLLRVEFLLLLLIILIRLCISSVWRRGRRMRRKVLRVGRSRRLRNVVFWMRSRRIPCVRNCCPFSRAGWRTIGRRWLSYRRDHPQPAALRRDSREDDRALQLLWPVRLRSR